MGRPWKSLRTTLAPLSYSQRTRSGCSGELLRLVGPEELGPSKPAGGPDMEAVLRLLAERYGFMSDDVEHDDPFAL